MGYIAARKIRQVIETNTYNALHARQQNNLKQIKTLLKQNKVTIARADKCRKLFIIYFSCFTIGHTPTKLQVLLNFWSKICYNPLSPPLPPAPVLSRVTSARLFSVPQVENEVKGLHFADVAEIQEVVTDESPKRGIFGSLSETVRQDKSLYICHWSLFWIKKGMCLPHVFRWKKVLKLWTALCINWIWQAKCVCRRWSWGAFVQIILPSKLQILYTHILRIYL
jgi:hypothetical protein